MHQRHTSASAGAGCPRDFRYAPFPGFQIIVIVLLLILPLAGRSAENWIELTENLEASGVGKSARPLEVDPATGDLYLLTKKGLWTSIDQGQTWRQVENTGVKGAFWYALSLTYDPATGGLAAFMKDPPEDPWQSVFRPTAEGDWKSFTRITIEGDKLRSFGWSWGDVHWDGENTHRLIARMHHSERIWLSTDAGRNWRELDKTSIFFGFTPSGAILVYDEKAKTLRRSGDDGASWDDVATDVVITGRLPVRRENKIFWVVENGLVLSADDGRTWQSLTNDLPKAFWGPYFGLSGNDMIVVTLDGVQRSDDGGATWKKVAGNRAVEVNEKYGSDKFRWDWFIGQTDWGWDAKNDIFYVTHGRLEQCALSQSQTAD